MTVGNRRTNDFCWINVMTPKAAEAKRFFGDLLGWTFDVMPGVPGGELIRTATGGVGALMDLDAGALPPGTPPAIGVLIKVDDAAATVTKVESLGGRAEGPTEVMENGRMALCTDPTGAIFGLWEPKKRQGMDADSHAHGAPGWYEVMSHDATRAASFYAELFGWKVEARETMPGKTYRRFKLGELPVGGAIQLDEQMAEIPSHWGVYFSVDDIQKTAEETKQLGGEVCMPITEIPGVGRFTLLRSPQQVAFHAMEWER